MILTEGSIMIGLQYIWSLLLQLWSSLWVHSPGLFHMQSVIDFLLPIPFYKWKSRFVSCAHWSLSLFHWIIEIFWRPHSDEPQKSPKTAVPTFLTFWKCNAVSVAMIAWMQAFLETMYWLRDITEKTPHWGFFAISNNLELLICCKGDLVGPQHNGPQVSNDDFLSRQSKKVLAASSFHLVCAKKSTFFDSLPSPWPVVISHCQRVPRSNQKTAIHSWMTQIVRQCCDQHSKGLMVLQVVNDIAQIG